MLEDAAHDVKRYAPPPIRNQVPNWRKSGERVDRISSSHVQSGDKIWDNSTAHPSSSAYWDDKVFIERNSQSRLIPLQGCHSREAEKFLHRRWAAVVDSYKNNIDLPGRPVAYSGGSDTSWAAQLKFPHQMDFLAELRRASQSTGT
ncbi:uncharacterized protein LOC144701127 isoform X2 [Wolffia australiana]